MNPEDCSNDKNCQFTSEEPDEDTYNEKTYKYRSAVTFLDYEKVSPGVIKNKEQVEFLKEFQVRVIDQNENVDGKFDFLI